MAWNRRKRNSPLSMDGRAQDVNGNFKTVPGAPLSPRDTMPTGLPGVSGGRTSNSTWDSFFHKTAPGTENQPVTSASESGAGRFAGISRGMGLDVAPQSGATGSDLAPFVDQPIIPDPSDPSSYGRAAMQSTISYFDSLGNPNAMAAPGVVNQSSPLDNLQMTDTPGLLDTMGGGFDDETMAQDDDLFSF